MRQIVHDMFTLGTPFLEFVIRPVLVYVFLVVALRLAGKRELAQVNSFDLVVLLTISNLLQNAGIGPDTSVLGGWIASASLLAANYLVVRLLFRHPRVGRLIEGLPTVLVEDGRVVYENLHKELLSEDDLIAAIHAQGVEEVRDVRRCEISPNGAIAVFQKHPTEIEQLDQEEQAVIGRLEELLRRTAAIEQRLAASES
jgi:uncharacterized membrane protein YcaP (DUF421 family)